MPVVDVGGSLQGKPNAVPYEDQAGMSEVQRKRLLMQQLLKESLSGGSGVVPDSGAIKVPDYAGAIGKVLQAYIGTKGAEAGAKEAADVAAKAQAEEKSAMGRFYDTAESKPFGGYQYGGQEMAGPPARVGEITGMSKGDMVQAIKNATMEKDPTVRALGMKLQEKETERKIAGRVEPLDVLKEGHNYDPNTMPPEWRAMAPGMQLPPTRGVQEGVYSEVTHGPTGTPNVFTAATNPFSGITPATATTPAFAKSLVTNEPKTMGAGNLANDPAILGQSERVKKEWDIAGKSYDQAIAANKVIDVANTIINQTLEMPPSAFGPGTDIRAFYNKVAQQLTGQTIPESVGTDKLNSAFADLVAGNMHFYSPSSDKDVKEVKVGTGSMAIGPESVIEIARRSIRVAERTMDRHDAIIERLGQKDNPVWAIDRSQSTGMPGTPVPGGGLPGQTPPSQSPTLTGTAAFNAMPKVTQEEVIQQREADPNLPHPLRYNAGTPATPAKKRIKFNELP